MPKAGIRKKPCTICRRWFRPNSRIGARQRACNNPDCQIARRKKTQASWRARNPDFAAAWRIQQRAQKTNPPAERPRLPKPLEKLPWDHVKDQFTPQAVDFIMLLCRLILRASKDEIKAYHIDSTGLSGTLPLPPEKTRSAIAHTEPRATGVSPTRPPLGDAASPGPAPPTPAAGLTG